MCSRLLNELKLVLFLALKQFSSVLMFITRALSEIKNIQLAFDMLAYSTILGAGGVCLFAGRAMCSDSSHNTYTASFHEETNQN